ncbi:MAG TPA: MarR family transcriptional regulator [Acidimicrobiales bacterium]|nr:MarR family transcriptional regulator [Acidimicrobiales bacterium]
MPEVCWLDDEEQRVWRGLLGVRGRLQGRLDEELVAAHGVNLGDYEVLVNLSEAPGRSMRMAELASRLALSPSGLTRRIDGLVRDGLVARRACPSDRRGSLAVLTEEGLERLESAAVTHVAGVRRYLIDPLGASRLAGLFSGLAQIEGALDGADVKVTRLKPAGPNGRRSCQPGSVPVAKSPPRSIQPFVPPATETAG